MEWSTWAEQSKASKPEYTTFINNHKDILFYITPDVQIEIMYDHVSTSIFFPLFSLSTPFLFLGLGLTPPLRV